MNKKILVSLPTIITPFFVINSLEIVKSWKSSSASLSYKVVYAMNHKLMETSFKFYNLINFADLNQLNDYVLPIILRFFQKNPLTYFTEKLNYNLQKLQINNYISHDNNLLTLNCIYYEKRFTLKIPLNDNFNNYDIATSLINFLSNLSQKYKPLLFSWNSFTDLLKKINIWFSQATSWSFFINQKLLNFDCQKIEIIGLNFHNWSQNSEIQIIFDYLDAKTNIINLKFDNIINPSQIIELLIKSQFDTKIMFSVDETVNYENFWENLPLQLWKNQIKDFFAKNPLVWNNQIVKFDWNQNNLQIENSQLKHPINPWSRSVNVKLVLSIEGQNIDVNLSIAITAPLDYEEITKSFKKQISGLEINLQMLSKNDYEINKKILKTIIIKHFNEVLIFKNHRYAIGFEKTLTVIDYKLMIFGKYHLIKIKINDPKINKQDFEIVLITNNFDSWGSDYLCNYF